MTDYEVFAQVRKGDEDATWLWAATLQARSASAAIRAYLDGGIPNSHERTYAAVPSRSWRPVSVTVETETRIKIG